MHKLPLTGAGETGRSPCKFGKSLTEFGATRSATALQTPLGKDHSSIAPKTSAISAETASMIN